MFLTNIYSRRNTLLGGSKLVCLSLAFLLFGTGVIQATESILVLPLRALPSHSEKTGTPPDWLGPAFSIVLAENLHGDSLNPISPEAVFLLMEEKGKTPAEGLSLASSLVLARDLEVDLVLAGRAAVLPSGKLAIWVYLIQTDPLRELSRMQRTFAAKDTPWILKEIMEAVSANLEERPEKPVTLMAPSTLEALSAYVEARMTTDPAEQQARFKALLAEVPDFPEANFHLARSLFRSGQSQEAENILRPLVRKDFRYTGQARVLLGLIALRNDKTAAARIHLEKATMIDNSALAHLALAYLARKEGKESLMRQELNIAGALGAPEVKIQAILEGEEVVP